MFFCCHGAWPYLVARGGGSIVNVASVAGISGLKRIPQVAHAATKAAVLGMTRQLAAEGGPVGIRANSISPGLIETPATAELLAQGAEGPVGYYVQRTALGRTGQAPEVVRVALFLASAEASYVTGANFVADGGLTVVI